MNISVIGTGYVGLVGGTCFAESGNHVLCVDNNPAKLEKLRAGEIPIFEPGLEILFERNSREGRLKFTSSLEEAVEFAQVIFLALPTPPMEDGLADLKYVLEVARQIGPLMTEYKVIVNKSTVPVGTADLVREAAGKESKVEFDVVSNPEFLREGAAVNDFMKPERVVIGCSSTRAREVMEKLYRPFVRSGNPVIFMDERSAEMTKYAANSFLATKISFMNEIANLCELAGADVDKVRRGIGSDPRIGKLFLFPGVGYGGSCFPKDVSALFHYAANQGFDFRILGSVMKVNERQKSILVEKVISFFGPHLNGMTFGVWGLAFKPNTDDIREAPAIDIVKGLTALGAKVKGFDPEAMWQVKEYTDLDIELVQGQYEAATGADALLIVTEWNEFRSPDLDKLKSLLKTPVIFDGRNLFDPEDILGRGFYYNSIGRKIIDDRVKA